MPIAAVNHAAEPHCSGNQWSVVDEDALAALVAVVLMGLAEHAAEILSGTTLIPLVAPPSMRERMKRELILAPGAQPYHRDGLLFEIICWISARQQAQPNEVISDPHTKATQQGVDTVKIRFDPTTRQLIKTTIYEYKCTTDHRAQFRDHVVPAFKRYFDGERDPELIQTTIALLARYVLTSQEQVDVFSSLVNDRPLAFHAALTVQPYQFSQAHSIALFDDFADVGAVRANRFGDTLPLADVRGWFSNFAVRVWEKINV